MMAKLFEQLKGKISPLRGKDNNHKAHVILNDMTLQEELQDSYDLQALRAAKKTKTRLRLVLKRQRKSLV